MANLSDFGEFEIFWRRQLFLASLAKIYVLTILSERSERGFEVLELGVWALLVSGLESWVKFVGQILTNFKGSYLGFSSDFFRL